MTTLIYNFWLFEIIFLDIVSLSINMEIKLEFFKNYKPIKLQCKVLTKHVITSYFIIFFSISPHIEMSTYKTNLYKKDYILCFIFSIIP